ncbi:GntR family transcriptional regulator [Paenibacillus qinlingensis]|uniref:DNA-binding GntR family transcriptional regulator n=1 Tax=Paenibacillus qinlingensis TaxID=1837343 RepID=A0ABU1NSU2_9BACL|nr:GntR family transcriptional regulator [Paenibacillus qinlingensis]MDR6550520.1 DNA-binding GntR family transcriptional regulator [Paenibacillus qinlingensis]
MKKGLNRYVLTDEIYTLLKAQILQHDIPSGEKINIDQLARDLEVSNIPIREALSRLMAEELVYTVPFKGMYVAQISMQELDDMYEIRKELESLAIRKALPQIPEEKIANLDQQMKIWSTSHPAEDEDKVALIAEMNQSLHGLILEYCDNLALRNLIHVYIDRIQRYSSLFQKGMEQQLLQDEWNEHMLVVQGLMARDTVMAEDALLQHLSHSHQRTRGFIC